ncbi:class I SAM-dependent methyltransferase [Hoeflea sp. WL0058]|uniref:Class I SAM-dependent methyltransferase n=1 Tax=Flavimaribacter sediminis TaxID=2865987 RepID=A0AAE3D0W1_9HYPH|nr:class I SAM-dependent methyltransferase [Flavimaribacter sediminis]MBW8637028.1 class I SAM-dependent methyltransferase [Flavimaribacter sediminis]
MTATVNKDARFWDRIARKYSTDPIKDEEGYQKTLTRVSDFLRSDDSVLELGCGTGTTALHLATMASSYLATDISPQMIAIAQEKAVRSPNAQLKFSTGTVETLELQPDQYDAVLGFNYLHLVEDIDRNLELIRLCLKSGGYFISKTPCVGDMTPLIRLVIPLMRAVGKAPQHVHSIKASSLEEKIRNAGFDIIACEFHATQGKDVRPFIVASKPN